MQKKILAIAICMGIAGTALAQTSLNRTQEAEAIGIIVAAEGVCERVVRTQTIGKVDDGTTLIAVACVGGEEAQYVIQINNLGVMSYATTCKELAEGTQGQVRCFR